MAVEKVVSIKNGNVVKIEMNVASGVLNGQAYKRYGPAFLTANTDDGHGHGYRVFVAQASIPDGIDDEDAAMGVAMMEFAALVEHAESLNVIETVREHGSGGYVADLRE